MSKMDHSSSSRMKELALDKYRNYINLDQPFIWKSNRLDLDELHKIAYQLLKYFMKEYSEANSHHAPDDDYLNDMPLSQKTSHLRQLLTIRHPAEYNKIPDNIQQLLDIFLQNQIDPNEIQSAASLPRVNQLFSNNNDPFFSKIALWRGDITRLACDAIVNAGNTGLLGCFQPTHLCIDNVIHAQAGPQMRADCFTIMNKLKLNTESVGSAKITRAYNLSSRYVIHTVGPEINDHHGNHSISSGRSPTKNEMAELASCYISCLELASLVGLKSIAFCSISTGIFSFPQDKAAEIAIHTVREWLNVNRTNTSIELVIFNVFKPNNEVFYIEQFERIAGTRVNILDNHRTLNRETKTDIDVAIEWLKSSNSLLIAAAAGLSASAGLDYTSEKLVKDLYPGLYKAGFRTLYSTFGGGMSDELQWGYLFSQVHNVRYNWPPSTVYQQLKQIALSFNDNRFFIITTNADGMFERNDFPVENRLYTMQGDYSMIQCLRPCSNNSVWPVRKYFEAAYPYVDKKTQLLTDKTKLPRCPQCGGKMFLNVRAGDWFLSTPYDQQAKQYNTWLTNSIQQANAANRLLVILEIGVGFNTPSVLRWPMESLAERHKNIRLIRINVDHSEIPTHLVTGQKGVSLSMDATKAIQLLWQGFFNK
ncbi:unnamed protein product [Didymodactylos carnosus]|uniref:Protein-ADP-ribose hydrolase n=1 Tax=Didymodactylos carnosus TaxID=1234261 RepID=A0A814Z5L6_9BILA|nr:unnamed protein product [Didymodactylos carnosus]CAF1278168.1 unnamed protein product [Didymodactylos carnosus]CAF4001316.1 unnamed protein product [Didymodactylos carnosus]CAF4083085.1 unnamed protein product [Didymodactylos carnosus]